MIADWKEVLKTNFTDKEKLCAFLNLNDEQKTRVLQKTPFALSVPLRLAQKMQKGTLDDPILKQFVPLEEEHQIREDFFLDPVEDAAFQQSGKLLKKYKSRSLILTTSACAMHCRYCFRRNYPYETSVKDFTKELELLANDPDCEEVILSGGDPLSLSDKRCRDLLDQLSAIAHVKKIRFHSRFPIGIPERITAELLSIFTKSRPQIVFIIHANHALELDDDVINALKKIALCGIPLLMHTVLLQGINDTEDVLCELFTRATNAGIIPYYLFQLDRVQGSAHFEVKEEKGKQLIKALQARLPGYAVPRYAVEIPHRTSKTIIV